MSTYLPDSEISRFNRAVSGEWFDISPETAQVVQVAQQISRKSAGTYDITVGPLVRFGISAIKGKRCISRPAPPSTEAIEGAQVRGLSATPGPHPTAWAAQEHAKLEIDLSSIAKGYAVDRVAQLFEERKLNNYMVEIGGEVRTGGVRGMASHGRLALSVRTIPNAWYSASSRFAIKRWPPRATTVFFLWLPANGIPIYSIPEPGAQSHTRWLSLGCRQELHGSRRLATTLLILGPDHGAAWAEQHQIAAVLLFRRDGKIVEQTTPRFDQLTTRQPADGASAKSPGEKGPAQKDPAQKSSTGLTLLLTVIVIAVSLFGMAVGVLINKRCLRGSCGGLAELRDAHGQPQCDACTNLSSNRSTIHGTNSGKVSSVTRIT